MKPQWYVGLMTGTVLDGEIDVALIRTDGEQIGEFGPYALVPYDEQINQCLRETLTEALAWGFEGPEPASFAAAERMLTLAQSDAVERTVADAGLVLGDIAAVGFHGQTVLHRAPTADRHGQTRQLGDGALMARALGRPVVFDFRSADMAAGGQGAPLSASYHAALLARIGAGSETAILNLGGVANITWHDDAGRLCSFDTGPANAPINDWMVRHGLGPMDREGRLARSGTVDEARLAALCNHPYLAAPFPKSLDRFDFGADMADGLSPADGAALLTAFVGAAVGRALDLLPRRPQRLIVCGGGRHNPALIGALADRAGVDPVLAESVGWRGDAIEAECFAFLAARRLRDLPISFPTTTGVPRPMTGGSVCQPAGSVAGDG